MARGARMVAVAAAVAVGLAVPNGTAGAIDTPWSVSPTPQPLVRQASLAGVACPATDFCLAVGEATDRTGRGVALSEVWNGSTWSVIRAPSPPGARSAKLLGIECTAPDSCMAVGASSLGTLAERWDGTSWSVLATPDPPGAGPSVLRAISCFGLTLCMAVGDRDRLHRPMRPLVERWDGERWSIAPLPDAGTSLSSVACPAADSCVAVGRDGSNGFAEIWDGDAWQVSETRTRAVFSGVACPAPSACYAVASYELFTQLPVIERWDGSSWSPVTVEWPGNLVLARLDAVECAAVGACVAAGFGLRSNQSHAGTLVARWDGGAWSVPRTPSLPHASVSELQAVACSSSSRCLAVGIGETGRTSEFKALAIVGDGDAWSLSAPINPRGAEPAGLGGVSCTSASFCMAVGMQWTFGLPGAPRPGDPPPRRGLPGGADDGRHMTRLAFAERWDGTRWTLVPMAVPPGSFGIIMYGISCTSPQFCMAVGVGGTRDVMSGLAEVWDGTSWSIAPTPNPTGQSELLGVTCPVRTDCVAVGDHGSFFNDLFTLAEHWNGRKWVEMDTPSPEKFSSLEFVSCPRADACTAVGHSSSSLEAPEAPLAERWGGTEWSVQKTPNPGGDAGATLEGVSCATVDHCVAVGSTSPYSGRSHTLAERWNGRSWRVTDTPTGRNDALYAVACPTVDRCVAVGARTNGPLAQVWDGATWSVSTVRSPSDSGWLPAVACLDTDHCSAAGLWFDGSFANTLVEVYAARSTA